MTHDEFVSYNRQHNDALQKYLSTAAQKDDTKPKFILPESDRIYFKDFHFLEEPLIERQKKREEQKKSKKAQSD